MEDQYTAQFVELNTAKLGKIKEIKSYITGIGLVNSQNKLYILGQFGLCVYDQPLLVNNSIASFDINDSGIYVADTLGELYCYSFQKDILKS